LIMYTIVADETLYTAMEDIPASEERWIDGVLMQVEIMPNQMAKIIRLLSPELGPYLNVAYMPGRMIKL
jgi:hypothetical protein